MTSRIELVPMSTAARRGGGGATARAGVGAAPPVAAGTLVWAVALAMLPDRCGVREMAPPAAHVNAPPGSRISPLCNGCATARSRRQALVSRRDERCSFARMKLWGRLLVAPGRSVQRGEWDPEDTLGQGKDAATEDALRRRSPGST